MSEIFFIHNHLFWQKNCQNSKKTKKPRLSQKLTAFAIRAPLRSKINVWTFNSVTKDSLLLTLFTKHWSMFWINTRLVMCKDSKRSYLKNWLQYRIDRFPWKPCLYILFRFFRNLKWKNNCLTWIHESQKSNNPHPPQSTRKSPFCPKHPSPHSALSRTPMAAQASTSSKKPTLCWKSSPTWNTRRFLKNVTKIPENDLKLPFLPQNDSNEHFSSKISHFDKNHLLNSRPFANRRRKHRQKSKF